MIVVPTNFDFLKSSDKNLYEIISDAEMLYRDEYYEQCITQTRKFAENVCKKTLGSLRTTEETFDQMLETLKDNSNGSEEEKEFIDDLYFLKKCGNQVVHSSKSDQNGLDALECLQRAFEVGINYAVYIKKAGKDKLNLHFDIDLLATGRKNKSLARKYQKGVNAATNRGSSCKDNASKTKQPTKKVQQSTMKSTPKPKKITPYWILVGISSIVAFCLAIFILMLK